MTVKILSKEDILALHRDLIDTFGGAPGIRDEGLLDSAVHAPFQTFGNAEFYPTLEEKASRLGYGLTVNHPFLDGNKRIGAHAMLTFLALNGCFLRCTNRELSDCFLSVASGETGEGQLLDWIRAHR